MEIREDFINWEADVTLLFLPEVKPEELPAGGFPELPVFGLQEDIKKGKRVKIFGYTEKKPRVETGRIRKYPGNSFDFFCWKFGVEPPEVLYSSEPDEYTLKEELIDYYNELITLDTDGKSHSGLSGSPVVNSQGKVIGIYHGKGVSIKKSAAIPIHEIEKLIERLAEEYKENNLELFANQLLELK